MYIKEARFSLWADFIERNFLDNEFRTLISEGIINGATSNPAIFKSAILTSEAYKEQIASMGEIPAKEKYEKVAIYDIQKAADILKPLYDNHDDGFVSIEVDPFLCDDADATIEEGKRLYAQINRPNVMIKVPATEAGYMAMEALSSEGIAVNATLVFSVDQAIKCAKAFEAAARKREKASASVISVFVSRVDRAIDDTLRKEGVQTGLTGILNAADIYNRIEEMNVPNCRVLFASTGVKGDEFRPSYYVDELLAPNSVNTAPVATIEAYVKGKDTKIKLPIASEAINEHLLKVKAAGVDMEKIIAEQIREGLEAFKVAFEEILTALKG